MENGSELRAMQVAAGSQGGQAEVVAPIAEIPETQVSAEMAVEQTPEVEIPPVIEEQVQETPSSSEPYNYWLDLDSKTEGTVKDEDSLLSLVNRGKEYDALVEEKKTLFKPANEYISKLNEMALSGANPDQIKAFVKLNDYGDLAALSPIELKVTKMVLTQGYSEDIARKIVNREYDLTQFDEDYEDQKDQADIMREKLRIESKSDLVALNEYKKELSAVNNPEKENAEKAQLQRIADASAYNKQVDAQAPNIAKHFPTKIDYDFKVGEDSVKYEDAFDKQFLEQELPKLVKDYFKDSMDPVNPENIGLAYSYAMGEYLKANDSKRLEKAFQKGDSAGYERAVNKYENRSGLPKAQENQVIATNESGLAEFTKMMVGR